MGGEQVGQDQDANGVNPTIAVGGVRRFLTRKYSTALRRRRPSDNDTCVAVLIPRPFFQVKDGTPDSLVGNRCYIA